MAYFDASLHFEDKAEAERVTPTAHSIHLLMAVFPPFLAASILRASFLDSSQVVWSHLP